MRRKPEHKIEEDWISTYGDTVTLLLCFFVMMLAASTPDMAKYEQIQAGLTESLGKKQGQRPIEDMLSELQDNIQNMDIGNQVSLGSDLQGIVMEFGNDLMFTYGSAAIRTEALPALKSIASTLQADRYRNFIFNIEGHTSNEPFSSPQYASNWELSSARAAAVARFLESRGIPRVRLRAIGLYDIAPKYPNEDPYGEPIPENRVRNRRVVIHIEPSYSRN